MDFIKKRLKYHLLINESNISVEDKFFLFETEVSKINSFKVDSLDEVGYDSDVLLTYFELLYELEYNQILSKPFNGPEKRKHNILNIIEAKANQLVGVLSESFINVFEVWLNNHDLDNPEKFAETRVKDNEDTGEPLFNYFISEYKRYGNQSNWGDIWRNIEQGLNKGNLPILSDVLDDYITYDYKNRYFSELENDGLERFNDNNGKEFATEEEARDYIENIELSDVLDYLDEGTFEVVVGENDSVYIELFEKIIFPIWYTWESLLKCWE